MILKDIGKIKDLFNFQNLLSLFNNLFNKLLSLGKYPAYGYYSFKERSYSADAFQTAALNVLGLLPINKRNHLLEDDFIVHPGFKVDLWTCYQANKFYSLKDNNISICITQIKKEY